MGPAAFTPEYSTAQAVAPPQWHAGGQRHSIAKRPAPPLTKLVLDDAEVEPRPTRRHDGNALLIRRLGTRQIALLEGTRAVVKQALRLPELRVGGGDGRWPSGIGWDQQCPMSVGSDKPVRHVPRLHEAINGRASGAARTAERGEAESETTRPARRRERANMATGRC
jgi:hypothetical protein